MLSPDSPGGPNLAIISIVCGWVFISLAIFAVALQVWGSVRRGSSIGGDILLVLATIISVGLVSHITWAIVRENFGKHDADNPGNKISFIARSLLINQTLWGLVNTLIRVNAIVFKQKTLLLRWPAWTLLVLSILYGVVLILEVFLICRPLALDLGTELDTKCSNQVDSYLSLEICGLLLDVLILIIPLLRV
ncbi:hypothetical protein HYALB_00003919 [Hymenoscyphus albidus]|uniref:Rhodopsin domain-containing protein n=1 Tax=Hymenoscyphus albidus TaxID=595503 RepID=A0A9N9LS84_9HELO|nr:hypothetical protein HYALB_00003919 [Hymenoscyphus albidus]